MYIFKSTDIHIIYIYIYMHTYLSIVKFDPTHDNTSGVPFLSFQVRTLLEEKHPTPGKTPCPDMELRRIHWADSDGPTNNYK